MTITKKTEGDVEITTFSGADLQKLKQDQGAQVNRGGNQ